MESSGTLPSEPALWPERSTSQRGIDDAIASTLGAGAGDMEEFAKALADLPVPTSFGLANTARLWGLFSPAPQWPPERLTVGSVARRAFRAGVFLGMLFVPLLGLIGFLLLLLPLLLPLLLLLLPCIAGPYIVHRLWGAAGEDEAGPAPDPLEEVGDWHSDHARYFSTKTAASQMRRQQVAESLLTEVNPQQAARFNAYISTVTSLAVYGCGVLISSHVGALRALERHGLQMEKLTTLAGVSAGAVVVAMVAVGYNAEELKSICLTLPFASFARPELGAVLRGAGAALHGTLLKMGQRRLAALTKPLSGGHGPGLNTGTLMQRLVGETLHAKCGDAWVTLRQVASRFGKRLVIIATELDSGRELRLTPESHPDLPVQVAVRMSMGVPGLMEPFWYNGHVYCDGGMMNDFPMDALPEGHRLGLMVRPIEWVAYNSEILEEVVGASELEGVASLKEHFENMQSRLMRSGVYSTLHPLDYMFTCVSVMMDANLMLQIKATTELDAANREASRLWQALESTASTVKTSVKSFISGQAAVSNGEASAKTGEASTASAPAATPNTPAPAPMGLSKLAPKILTLCGGALDPFDFMLSPEQRLDLFNLGQLAVHMHAAQLEGEQHAQQVMSNQAKLKLILLMLHLQNPSSADASPPTET